MLIYLGTDAGEFSNDKYKCYYTLAYIFIPLQHEQMSNTLNTPNKTEIN